MFEQNTTKLWKHVFVILSVNSGLGWSLSNRGDEVSMYHFKEIGFLVEKHNCLAQGVLKWS